MRVLPIEESRVFEEIREERELLPSRPQTRVTTGGVPGQDLFEREKERLIICIVLWHTVLELDYISLDLLIRTCLFVSQPLHYYYY